MLASASASTEAVSKLLHVLSKNIQLQADSGLLESTNMKIMVTQLLEPLTAEEKRVHKAWANKKYRDNSRHGVQRTDVVAIQGDVLLSCDRETDGSKKVQRCVTGDRVGSVGVFCGENSKW